MLKARPIVAVTAISLLPIGCHSRPAPPPATTSQTQLAQFPTRPSIAAPSFKIFHHDGSTFTLVTRQDATDAEVEAIIWQLRDAAHTHTLDKLNISEKAIDDHKPTAWFHIYRGAKCAAEKYASGEPPCGGSYHAAGDYTFGSSVNPNWDDGILRNDETETPLWNPDVSYVRKER